MPNNKLPPHYGHGVSGDRFWPRPELQLVLSRLRQGKSIALFGPRRTGKSSLLRESARTLKEVDKLTVIEVNGEGMDAVASLFNRIVASLPAQSYDGLKARFISLNAPERLKQILQFWKNKDGREDRDDTALVTRHWATLAQEIARLIPTMQPRPVLFIDELTYLCENLHDQAGGSPDEVQRLLAMLREWRGEGMAMAIAGSIGIRQYLRKLSISRIHLNGIIPVPIKPMTNEDAQNMLLALAAHEELQWWHDGIGQTVIENCVDLIPASLQFAFDYVVQALEVHGDKSHIAISAVFQAEIRPLFDQEFYHQFDERFSDYSDIDQVAAREIFGAIARSSKKPCCRSYSDIEEALAKKLTQEQLADLDLADLIAALVDDGFLFDDPDQDQIAFASNLVAGWWRIRDHRRGRRRQRQSN